MENERKESWLEKMDRKAKDKGNKIHVLWQIVKFTIVSLGVTFIQIGLVNLLYFLMKGYTEGLPGFLANIFTEDIMGEGHSNWGYILPFFLSNAIANTIGYFVNRSKTFRSNAPIWHYFLYIIILIILVLFTTWLQGLIVNAMNNANLEGIAPTTASIVAGTVQFIIIFPLQKFVLLRNDDEKNEDK